MRNAPIVAATLIFLLASQVVRGERYVLEANHSLASELRDESNPSAETLKTADPAAKLIPLFPLPAKAEMHAAYYNRGLDRWFVLEASSSSATVATLRDHDGVSRFGREQLDMTADVTPDDYSIHDLWHLDDLKSQQAWDIYNGPRKVTLAVVDAGFDTDHPDLVSNFHVNQAEDINENGRFDAEDIDGIDNDGNGYVDDVLGYDFVTVTESYFQDGFEPLYAVQGEDYGPVDNEVFPDIAGHGTHVAGCAGAVNDNGIGVASPAWSVELMPLRAAFTCERQSGERVTTGWATDFAQAIYYAVNNGAKVISFSYSRTSETESVLSAIQFAQDNGVLFFASAGNRGITTPVYPAAYPEAIAVTALGREMEKPPWASMGTWVELCAPGVAIWSTMSSDLANPVDYQQLSGTSMATPLVASVAALAFASNPLLLAHDVRILLSQTATSVDSVNPTYAGALGAGMVNGEALLQRTRDVVVSPDSLEVLLDDREGIVALSWTFPLVEVEESPFNHFEIVRDGEVVGVSTTAEATDQLQTYGYHSYHVNAVYQSDERRSSGSVATFYLGPYGAIPEMETIEVVDNQFGVVEARWSRGTVTGVHKFHELRYDTDESLDLINMPYRGVGMRVTPDAPCRLLQVRFYAQVQQAGAVTVDLYDYQNGLPGTIPIATTSATVDSGEGWQVVDLYNQSVALSDEMVICVRPETGTILQLGICDDDVDRAWLPVDDTTWQQQDNTFAIRALIAVRDEDRQDSGTGSGSGAQGKVDEDDPWCRYTFYESGEELSSTLDTLCSTRLTRTGQSNVRLHADYANGASTWSRQHTIEWDRGLVHFEPVEPTTEVEPAYVSSIRIDNATPTVPIEVGVFDGELCVGAIRIEPGHAAPYRIALWGEQRGQQLPGYREGENISYRLWFEGSEADEERELLVVQENDVITFGGEAPRVSFYSYVPQPPSNFSILDPEEDVILQPDDDYMLSFSWSYAEDPDPFQSARYDFYAHLTCPEYDTLLLFSLTSRSYLAVNLPVSAGISQWSDTLTAKIWIEASSPPDRVRSDNTLLVHFLSEFSGPIPNEFQLGAAYPNPFNGFVNLPLALPEKGAVNYELYDVLGRRLAQREVRFNAGYHILQLGDDLRDVMPGSGVYFLRVRQGSHQQVQKLVHMK